MLYRNGFRAALFQEGALFWGAGTLAGLYLHHNRTKIHKYNDLYMHTIMLAMSFSSNTFKISLAECTEIDYPLTVVGSLTEGTIAVWSITI